jgi:membrane fusion protein, multidrug efflux system
MTDSQPPARAALLALLALLAGCGGAAVAGSAAASGNAAAAGGAGGASPGAGGAAQSAGAPVSVGLAERRDVPVVLRAVGTVESPASVVLKPQVEGRVVEVRFHEGADVQAGDVLVLLDPRPAQAALKLAEATLARDRALAADAALAAEQMGSVHDTRAVSERTLQQSRATADAAVALVAADEAAVEAARIALDYCTLRAPFDGRTGLLGVRVGSVVKANETELLTIRQVAPVRVAFSVPQGRLPEIRARHREAPLAAEVTPVGGEPVRGDLSFVDNTVDTETGTIRLMAEFPNGDKALWPGQYVEVALQLGIERGALVVPAAAVQAGQQGDYLFAVRADRTVELRVVPVLRATEEFAVLGGGVEPGETVVTDGQLRLVDGARVAFDG